jgi:aurora kinase
MDSAIKTINKARLRTRGAEDLVKREVDIHSQLRYRGILELYTWFEDSYNYFLVLAYAPGGELVSSPSI